MSKKLHAVGIDVGSKTFHVAVHGRPDVQVFENSIPGRKAVIATLKKLRGGVKIVLESTGAYGLDLALRLHKVTKFVVYYVNPKAAKGYASRGFVRAKCDRVDALMLARMAADDLGAPWCPPREHVLHLRCMTRRIRTLVNDKTREKNRLEAGRTGATPQFVLDDIEDNISMLERRIKRLRKATLEYAREHAELAAKLDLLVTIPGVADNTAVEVLAEMECMPNDLTAKQLVAQAGLDPRAKQSGKKDGPRRISKMGSKYLRASLFMAAFNSSKHSPEIAEFRRHFRENKHKPYLVTMTAISRKLLHCIHGMLKSETAFDADRFYKWPGEQMKKSA